jgi:uncharacterized protein YndB with AHSA1/START domain
MRVASDRRYRFGLPPGELWEAATQVDQYRSWWPWLRHLEGAGFAVGSVWECEVQPPLPYRLRFSLSLEEVRAPSLVRATLSGDIVGDARLEVRDHHFGSQARLVSDLAPRHGLLQAVAFVTLPLARFGHDWVLDHGARQFGAAVAVSVDPDPIG